jgi:hypothetical protein
LSQFRTDFKAGLGLQVSIFQSIMAIIVEISFGGLRGAIEVYCRNVGGRKQRVRAIASKIEI